MTPSSPPNVIPSWQPEKHLQSGDRIFIVTDVERFTSKYYGWSTPQKLFRVGIYDLATGRIGYANFGRDIASFMMKAGLPAPPWTRPMQFGVAVYRASHDGEPNGRFRGRVELVQLEPAIASIGPIARKLFSRGSSTPNAVPGMWQDLEDRAREENAIEAAVRGMAGSFSAGDVKKIVGKDVDVTPVLQRLVAEGTLLPPTGKKRGTRYRHAPPLIVERSDWTT